MFGKGPPSPFSLSFRRVAMPTPETAGVRKPPLILADDDIRNTLLPRKRQGDGGAVKGSVSFMPSGWRGCQRRKRPACESPPLILADDDIRNTLLPSKRQGKDTPRFFTLQGFTVDRKREKRPIPQRPEFCTRFFTAADKTAVFSEAAFSL